MTVQDFEVKPNQVSIAPLLQRLAYPAESLPPVEASEIAAAFALIFEDRLSAVQTAALLTLLHSTQRDKDPQVIAQCSQRMRDAALKPDLRILKKTLRARGKKEGKYGGGICDIVGTGGDSHSTFNISTTSSIIASPLILMAKHGNRAQTSMSGSADVLNAIVPTPPNLTAISASNIADVYGATNYAFLYAPNFHPGMGYASPVRRGLGLRTIFNLMGPLANPLDAALEARVVGVAYKSLGPVFAEALLENGCKKALVVCGAEDLDEISCAGPTNCWRLTEYPNPEYKGPTGEDNDGCTSDDDAPPRTVPRLESFTLVPSDFGLQAHPLSAVHGRKLPGENAAKLMSILRNELPRDDPILTFVLMNVAALLVISGICESDTSNMGPGDDGKVITERGPGGARWKEGVRRARWCIESGASLGCLEKFIEVSNKLQ
ncbi:glycosyl transferase [Aspergillus ambiguus]|uniref:anthranilate phosphoribosyltransferase n=1 Tax=Aspergillus ambiguus TaxID=176160 RepID=UPI003CCD7923